MWVLPGWANASFWLTWMRRVRLPPAWAFNTQTSLKPPLPPCQNCIKCEAEINPKLEIAGILITMADMRTNYSREIVELLRDAYGGSVRIFDSIIPLSIRAAGTSAGGRSVYLHDPAGKVSAAYAALTQEVMAS